MTAKIVTLTGETVGKPSPAKELLDILETLKQLVEQGDIKALAVDVVRADGGFYRDHYWGAGMNAAAIIGTLDMCKRRVVDEIESMVE